MADRTTIWNCGGGTQSTAMAILIATGHIPKPDLAVIADTERERSSTWEYLDRYTMPMLTAAGVTLHRVPKSRYATVDLWGGKDGDTLLIPAFTDQGGDIGKMPAFCSNEWKSRVVQRWATIEHGVRLGENWIGYSTDEARRYANAKPLDGKWTRRYPLVEARISRGMCYRIVEKHGWPKPPHSSCWMCPNHAEEEWREIKSDPADFERVKQFEAEIQARDPHAWLHSSCAPIDDVDFDPRQNVMFGGCESGQCFV